MELKKFSFIHDGKIYTYRGFLELDEQGKQVIIENHRIEKQRKLGKLPLPSEHVQSKSLDPIGIPEEKNKK